MTKLERLGLGCMGMTNRRNPENSIKTIHTALDAGITLFNAGEFYSAGESESKEDIKHIKAAIPADKISGKGMRNFRFTNGQITLA